jgi:hypothetical protein
MCREQKGGRHKEKEDHRDDAIQRKKRSIEAP